MTREPDLVPIRHGRMLISAFTFYWGAAKLMAADLRHTPTDGLTTQLCGEGPLSSFGMFAASASIGTVDRHGRASTGAQVRGSRPADWAPSAHRRRAVSVSARR